MEIKMEDTMVKLKQLQQLSMPPRIASVIDDLMITADANFSTWQALMNTTDSAVSAISATTGADGFDYSWWFR
jgi:hypothetical protein